MKPNKGLISPSLCQSQNLSCKTNHKFSVPAPIFGFTFWNIHRLAAPPLPPPPSLPLHSWVTFLGPPVSREEGGGRGVFRPSRGSSRRFRGTDRQNEEQRQQKAREMFLWSIFDCQVSVSSRCRRTYTTYGGEAWRDLLS